MRLMMIAALLLLTTCAFAGEFDFLAPDAFGLMLPADAGAAGERIDTASWRLGEVIGRQLWLDLFEPLEDFGAGASLDLTPGGPACAGVGYRNEDLFGYVGAHMSVSF